MNDEPKISPGEQTRKSFRKAGKFYISPAGRLTLHHRHEFTDTKPEKYLMFYPPDGGQPKYLTGLYPVAPGLFTGENRGVYWEITLTDREILFQRIGEGGGGKVL